MRWSGQTWTLTTTCTTHNMQHINMKQWNTNIWTPSLQIVLVSVSVCPASCILDLEKIFQVVGDPDDWVLQSHSQRLWIVLISLISFRRPEWMERLILNLWDKEGLGCGGVVPSSNTERQTNPGLAPSECEVMTMTIILEILQPPV